MLHQFSQALTWLNWPRIGRCRRNKESMHEHNR